MVHAITGHILVQVDLQCQIANAILQYYMLSTEKKAENLFILRRTSVGRKSAKELSAP